MQRISAARPHCPGSYAAAHSPRNTHTRTHTPHTQSLYTHTSSVAMETVHKKINKKLQLASESFTFFLRHCRRPLGLSTQTAHIPGTYAFSSQQQRVTPNTHTRTRTRTRTHTHTFDHPHGVWLQSGFSSSNPVGRSPVLPECASTCYSPVKCSLMMCSEGRESCRRLTGA